MMTNTTIYKAEKYKKEYKGVFAGIYNDFKQNAEKDYHFELTPLEYDEFIKSVENGLLECLILFEDNIPTGFLVYTTLISEALELNIIHCIGSENINKKRRILLEKFIEINKKTIKEKIVTYPMLGKQSDFANDIKAYGFKTINTSVTAYNLKNILSVTCLRECFVPELPKDYMITDWKTIYSRDLAEIINQSFKDTSDSLFDTRFTTIKGCKDITDKITENIYGEFLPSATKVLLYKKHVAGICFANLTNSEIANIPLVAIQKKHRGKGFGKILLKSVSENIIRCAITYGWNLKEINATCDCDNIASVRMYNAIGFSEKYSYPQACLLPNKS